MTIKFQGKRTVKRYVRAMVLRSLEHDLDELGAEWIYENTSDPAAVEAEARKLLAGLRARWGL